jgi:uncharacterized protein
MRFEGVLDSNASKTKVFEMTTDPSQLAGCVPDLQKFEVKSEDEFVATVRAGAGFIRGDFALNFKTAERDPPNHSKLLVHGTGMGSAVDVVIDIRITDRGTGGSTLNWTADAAISGKIASVGQRLIQGSAEKIINRFFECFRQKIEKAA